MCTTWGSSRERVGPFALRLAQVRMPDVAFTSWERLPGKVVPDIAIPDLAPDLAVEVLSDGNTVREMERKLTDYFLAGVRSSGTSIS